MRVRKDTIRMGYYILHLTSRNLAKSHSIACMSREFDFHLGCVHIIAFESRAVNNSQGKETGVSHVNMLGA